MAELAEFEGYRRLLFDVAYRMLGSVGDAEDAVQETWLRWQKADHSDVEDARRFLTTVISRLCLDMLGSARVRRESYVGEWLPEPLVAHMAAAPSPEDKVALDESVGLALLAVLERLSPAERTALVLHDVFGMPFSEVAEVVERSPEAVRQLASRARRRVRQHAPKQSVDRQEHQQAVQAFLTASVSGDLEGLLHILDPDVVWRADGGGVVTAARRPVWGPEKVARLACAVGERLTSNTVSVGFCDVNGAPGLYVRDSAVQRAGVLAFTVADGRITEIDFVVNPEKLTRLPVM
jgi:RNA polymerase sigma-70 factor (ECF subfamily)